MDEPVAVPKTFEEQVFEIRRQLRELEPSIKALHESKFFLIAEAYPGQHDEMHANVTLAYRHIEDAVMRFGKAIQAYDGGKSVYPR